MFNETTPAAVAHAAPAASAVGEHRAFGLALAVVLVVGVVLRLRGLGAGLWYDEIETLVRYVRQPMSHVVTTYDSQNQHLLYSVLAKLSITAFGDHAWALRLPAAVFGVASLWAVAWFGAAVAARREALLAALLLAVSYHHVWFSQNARGYTALLFFTLVGTRLFLELLRGEGGAARVWGYGAVFALALYTHLTAVFVLAAHTLLLLPVAWRARRSGLVATLRRPVTALVLAGALAALLYAPVLPSLLGTAAAPTMPGTDVVWRSPVWFMREALAGLARGLPGGWVALALGVAVTTAGVASLARRSPVTAAAVLLPAVVTGAALLVTAHNLWPRFFFFAAGFAALIVVRGTFAVVQAAVPGRSQAIATAVLGLAAVGSVVTVPRAWQPKQDFEGARAWVEEQRRPGDAVVVVDMARLPYERYLRTDWVAVASPADLEAVEAAHRRTWVAYTFPARLSVVQPEIWSRLRVDYRVAREFPGTVGGGAVVVMVRD